MTPTRYRYTGQREEVGLGLYYFNARYYDRAIGHFISPDTLVPDPTNVWDYNRFAYARLNPMKFTDPSGYYSNDEIMQHFGCNDWACVEANFREGGAYAGLWGWLYILQMAQNGDTVTAYGAGAGGMAIQAALGGKFQRSAAGQIEIVANYYEASATGLRRFNAVVPERGFATLAKAYDYGHYTLSGSANVAIHRGNKHNYLHFSPAQIDKKGVALGVVAAGKDVGPVVLGAGVAHGDLPMAFAGGVYWIVGEGFSLYTDLVEPTVMFGIYGDPMPLAQQGLSETATFVAQRVAPRAAPFVGPAIDLGAALAPGFCYGTGCPR